MKYDQYHTLDSIMAFPRQLQEAWQAAQKLTLNFDYQQAKNIVLAGMGGSALGGRVVKSLFENELSVPFEVVTEYHLPEYVNKDSLVIVASYSGNTEETLSCLQDAQKRQAKIFFITTGGKLAQSSEAGLVYQSLSNPLGYPKTAIGYSVGGLLGFLAKAKILKMKSLELLQIDLRPEAKKLARYFHQHMPVILGSDHLRGAAWVFKNEINEIAHSYCLFYDLPEMNHHLVEAFSGPDWVREKFVYWAIESRDYAPRIKQRYQITQKILKKLKITTKTYQVHNQNLITQALEVIWLGGLTAYYLSLLNKQDPGPEPWILYLKKELAAHAASQ